MSLLIKDNMAKIKDDFKKFIEFDNSQLTEDLKFKADYNTKISLSVSFFVFVIFTVYQFIFVYLDGHIDFRLSYLIPVLALVISGPITKLLYKKGCYKFIGKYTIFILHFLMYALAFWLDCFTDPSLCQIYTLLIIAVGPALFFQTFLTELFMNTLGFILYLVAIYFNITPLSAEHAVISAFIAYAISIFTLIVVSGMRYKVALSAIDLNKEKEARERYEYAAGVAEALNYDFLNVYSLDLKTDKWKMIKRNGYITKGTENATVNDEFPYKEIMDNYIKTRIHPDDIEHAKEIFDLRHIKEELKKSDAYIDSYRVLDETGEHYYQFRFVKVPSTDKVIAGFRCIDNTMNFERKQRLALQEALSAARQASEAKSVFLNNISHDVRTPLNAIMGFSKHAYNNSDKKQVVLDSLKHIETSGNQLLNYIDNILKVIELKTYSDNIKQDNYSLNQLFNEIIDKLASQAKEKNISITFDDTDIVNDTVKVNKERFVSCIYPVIDNAIKYTPDNGHVLIDISQGSSVGNGKIRYVFRVVDDGIGISKEHMKHVFDPFSRERNTTDSGVSGTGLSLSIVKNILESTGGGIVINSKPNKGTEVVMIAVLNSPSENSEEETIVNEDVRYFDNNKAFKDTRILIVDDNMINTEVASSLLKEKGFICDCVNSGAEAILKFKDSKPSYYSFILMDIMMPELNGFETTKEIRNLNKLDAKDVFIIALSANTNTIDKDKAIINGMNGFLAKPFNVEEFIQCANKLLKK